MPRIERPPYELPALTSSELDGKLDCRSRMNCWWSAKVWYELNHVRLGRAWRLTSPVPFLIVSQHDDFLQKPNLGEKRRTLVGLKGALLGNVGAEVLVQHRRLEAEPLELGHVAGGHGDVEVLAVVEVERDRGDAGDGLLDRGRVVVGRDPERLEAVVGDLLLEGHDGRGGGQRQRDGEGCEELHVGREAGTVGALRG